MKLSSLYEQPDYVDKEASFPISSNFMSISQDTLKREFKEIARLTLSTVNYVFAIERNFGYAIVGILPENQNERIRLAGQLEFKDAPDISSEKVLPFKDHILQVDGVQMYDKEKFRGLGHRLYCELANSGFNIISDNLQYKGGKALWCI